MPSKLLKSGVSLSYIMMKKLSKKASCSICFQPSICYCHKLLIFTSFYTNRSIFSCKLMKWLPMPWGLLWTEYIVGLERLRRAGVLYVILWNMTWIEITDFQMPDKTFDTIKYLPDILKIQRTSFQHAWVLKFKCLQLVYLLKCIITTFGMHQCSFCEINTYCVITFLLEKSYSWQKAIK